MSEEKYEKLQTPIFNKSCKSIHQVLHMECILCKKHLNINELKHKCTFRNLHF
jgi:hypothetical protein